MKKSGKTSGKRSGQAQNRTADTRIFSPVAKVKISNGSRSKQANSTANVELAAKRLGQALECVSDDPKFRILADDLLDLIRELEAA